MLHRVKIRAGLKTFCVWFLVGDLCCLLVVFDCDVVLGGILVLAFIGVTAV